MNLLPPCPHILKFYSIWTCSSFPIFKSAKLTHEVRNSVTALHKFMFRTHKPAGPVIPEWQHVSCVYSIEFPSSSHNVSILLNGCDLRFEITMLFQQKVRMSMKNSKREKIVTKKRKKIHHHRQQIRVTRKVCKPFRYNICSFVWRGKEEKKEKFCNE